MTAARARSSERVRKNSERRKDRLEGFQPVVEGWHAKVCLLGVGVDFEIVFGKVTAFTYYYDATLSGHLDKAVQVLIRYGRGKSLPTPKPD